MTAKPFAPIHLTAVLSGSDIDIDWYARGRYNDQYLETGIVTQDSSPTDLNEYSVRIYDGVTLLREESVTITSFTYTAAMQTTDSVAPSTDLTVKVARKSSIATPAAVGGLGYDSIVQVTTAP